MENKKTIVLVWKSGGDFHFQDVELITRHILGKWRLPVKPKIICLWDKKTHYDIGNIEFIPLTNDYPGTWSRMELYSPAMEQYRPFLYVDLDTAIINSLEYIFELVKDESQFITLEDFWQKGKLATGLVWFPAKSEKIKKVWDARKNISFGARMDYFLRQIIEPDTYWQRLTTTIYDFKPRRDNVLTHLPEDADMVCFHGKPRIFQIIASSMSIPWVQRYVEQTVFSKFANIEKLVTVIIPYNKDRGYLQEAIGSVPKDVQLLLSQGEGNWPENFNKALPKATGRYIRYLHEDDMLTKDCIYESVTAIEKQGVDFIHGNAIEKSSKSNKTFHYIPKIKVPTFRQLYTNNCIHSATLMYRREVFDELGGFDETLNASEELEFNLRCLKHGLKIGYCPRFLAIYRRHDQQKVVVLPLIEKRKEKAKILQKYKV